MASQAATIAQSEPQQPFLTKYELTPSKATYIINKSEMEELLENVFGAGVDFHVSVSKAVASFPHLESMAGGMERANSEADKKTIDHNTRRKAVDGFIMRGGN